MRYFIFLLILSACNCCKKRDENCVCQPNCHVEEAPTDAHCGCKQTCGCRQ